MVRARTGSDRDGALKTGFISGFGGGPNRSTKKEAHYQPIQPRCAVRGQASILRCATVVQSRSV